MKKQFQYVEGMDLPGVEVETKRKPSMASRLGLGIGAAVASVSSFAAIDTTAVTTAITDAVAAIATVGAAVLVAMVGVKVYKWIKAAL